MAEYGPRGALSCFARMRATEFWSRAPQESVRRIHPSIRIRFRAGRRYRHTVLLEKGIGKGLEEDRGMGSTSRLRSRPRAR